MQARTCWALQTRGNQALRDGSLGQNYALKFMTYRSCCSASGGKSRLETRLRRAATAESPTDLLLVGCFLRFPPHPQLPQLGLAVPAHALLVSEPRSGGAWEILRHPPLYRLCPAPCLSVVVTCLPRGVFSHQGTICQSANQPTRCHVDGAQHIMPVAYDRSNRCIKSQSVCIAQLDAQTRNVPLLQALQDGRL
jgi:hypothetical protein